MSNKDRQSDPPLSAEEEKKLHDFFQKLDVNKDGTIDINDLTRGMESMQVPQIPGHAQVGFNKSYKTNLCHSFMNEMNGKIVLIL